MWVLLLRALLLLSPLQPGGELLARAATPWRWQLDALNCPLPLTPAERLSAAGAQGYGQLQPGVPWFAVPPTFIIGVYPLVESQLLGAVLSQLVTGYTGYPTALQMVSMAGAPAALVAGEVHFMADFRGTAAFSSAAEAAAFLGQAALLPLGALGGMGRPGLYVSATLAARIGAALGQPSLRLDATPWSTLVVLAGGSDSAAGAKLLAKVVPAAIGGYALVLADAPGLLPTSGLYGSLATRICVPLAPLAAAKGLTVPTGAPANVLFHWYANFSAIIGCSLVTGGEFGLRVAMAAQVEAQGGRADLMVIAPNDGSPAVTDGLYGGMQRISLPPCGDAAAFSAGACDWPRDVFQKVASVQARMFFPTVVWASLAVRRRRLPPPPLPPFFRPPNSHHCSPPPPCCSASRSPRAPLSHLEPPFHSRWWR